MMMGGGWITGLVFLLLFLVLIGGLAAVVVWLIARQPSTGSTGQQKQPATREDSLEILRQRYARGEISREEYQTIREDLQS
jgi:putative membrane protein